MTNLFKKVLFIVLLTMIMCKSNYFQSGAMQISNLESEEMKIDEKYFLQFMDALKNRDTEKIFQLWVGDMNESNKDDFIDEFDYWNGREIISYKKVSEEHYSEKQEEKRPGGTTYVYEVVSEDKIIYLKFSITDEYKGGRYIDSYQFINNQGTSKSAGDYNQLVLIKWGLLAFRLVEIVFTFYVAFLCIRKKPKLWGLWLPFILLAYGGVILDMTSGFKVGAFVYILRFTEVLMSKNGIRIALSLPIGAVVYWLQSRKSK